MFHHNRHATVKVGAMRDTTRNPVATCAKCGNPFVMKQSNSRCCTELCNDRLNNAEYRQRVRERNEKFVKQVKERNKVWH
jgi:hypothetical protein